jgi:hypothetical protein
MISFELLSISSSNLSTSVVTLLSRLVILLGILTSKFYLSVAVITPAADCVAAGIVYDLVIGFAYELLAADKSDCL